MSTRLTGVLSSSAIPDTWGSRGIKTSLNLTRWVLSEGTWLHPGNSSSERALYNHLRCSKRCSNINNIWHRYRYVFPISCTVSTIVTDITFSLVLPLCYLIGDFRPSFKSLWFKYLQGKLEEYSGGRFCALITRKILRSQKSKITSRTIERHHNRPLPADHRTLHGRTWDFWTQASRSRVDEVSACCGQLPVAVKNRMNWVSSLSL
jgi:hypothetical protein